jgi:membrane protease YdiL (CAAX protease family)
MQKYIAALPRRIEFAIVVFFAFGDPIVGSVWRAFHPTTAPHHTELTLRALIIIELILLGGLGAFLYARGWSLKTVGLKVTAVDTLIGIGLALLAYVVFAFAWTLFAAAWPRGAEIAMQFRFANPGSLTLATAIVGSIVNPAFEELFVTGYVMTALRRMGREQLAFNASVGIRLTYHLYQGVLSVLSILPLGLICAFWYARTGRLWPLIVAHAFMDFVALMQFVAR